MMTVIAQAVSPVALLPDQVLGFVLLDLAIILAAARALGALARRFKQPVVVGEIVAGVLLGPTLLGPTLFTWSTPWDFLRCERALAATQGTPSIGNCLFPPQARAGLGIIGQIALILFMFLVGLELDHRLLRGKGKSIATVAVGVIAIPIGLGVLIGPLLYDSKWVGGFGTEAVPSELGFSLMVGAMLSVTAFPVMAHILLEKGMTRSRMGSVGIAATAVVSVFMFLAVALSAGVVAEKSPGNLGLKVVLFVAYIAAMLFVVRPALVPLGRAFVARGTLTPTMFGIVFMVVFVSAWAADRIGVNVIVGAFMAGAVLPARESLYQEMRARLQDITMVVLLPVFLAFSGLNTDFTTLGISFIGGIALFLAAGIVGKWLGGALSARLGGLTWSEGNVIGILMNCRGLLVLVVALIALNQGVISPQLQVGAVLMALITTMMTGPLFDAFLPRVIESTAGAGPSGEPEGASGAPTGPRR